ncbi:MAG TPA: Gfo/Idh/MocA family oxidoreductase [Armatimonadota bacterium]|nr:Gfo/Idh/MocA family oxidoreductase [Armatimonadota bacterium]
MSQDIRLAMIGLDTSHTVEFTKLMQSPDCPEELHVDGLHAVRCLRFATPFQQQAGLDDRQAMMEGMGVKVTEDFDEAIDDCDAIMLEINDPSCHLDYFARVAALGKPIFLDKPIAGTLADAREICALANTHHTRVMSCSNLRYSRALLQALADHPHPKVMNAFGVLGTPPAGEGVIWYGVHSFEMVQRAMGDAFTDVTAIETPDGIISVIEYTDGRQALVELGRSYTCFGGRLQSSDGVKPYVVDGRYLYSDLLKAVKLFLQGNDPTATLNDALSVITLMDATCRSLASGKPVTIATSLV